LGLDDAGSGFDILRDLTDQLDDSGGVGGHGLRRDGDGGLAKKRR